MKHSSTLRHPATVPALLLFLLVVWFCVAVGLAYAGFPAGDQNMVALSIAAPLLVWALLYVAVDSVRRAIDGLSTRTLVAIHAGRIFGFLFLVYSGHGLEPRWAVPAAWADIAVAVTALPIAVLAVPASTITRWRWAMGWTILAAIDIAVAPIAGLMLAYSADDAMSAMTGLPLFVIPAVFVPTMILTNVLIASRLIRHRPRDHGIANVGGEALAAKR